MGDAEQETEYRWFSTSHRLFLCEECPEGVDTDKEWDALIETIREFSMPTFYTECCRRTGRAVDPSLLGTLSAAHAERRAALLTAVDDARENHGDDEVRSALLALATHSAHSMDAANLKTDLANLREKTVALGQRLDIHMLEVRLGLYAGDPARTRSAIAECKTVLETLGDWERRNRLKVLEGMCLIAVREFGKAAELLLGSMATFTAHEVLTYGEFVRYAVTCATITLGRSDLKEKVIDAPEVLQATKDLQHEFEMARCLHACDYAGYFKALAEVSESLKRDRFFAPHARFYTREARIVAYSQFLVSYRSVTAKSMAASFGVTEDFLDAELARFVAAGRLHAKIDRVRGIVETTRPDKKNEEYQELIRRGDTLLNRVQKLSRVISF